MLLLAGIVLTIRPDIDLSVARLFYKDGHFIGDTAMGRLMRAASRTIPFLVLIALTLLWFAGRIGRRRMGPSGRAIAWLFLSLLLGPGLTVDGLKEISHRPRPVQVKEFGGNRDFRPFYSFDGACPRNCSFPSGETSAAAWTLAPASLAPPPLRTAALVAALAFGLATGTLRMAFGGHFASDVVFAELLTLVVLLISRRRLWSAASGSPAETARPLSII